MMPAMATPRNTFGARLVTLTSIAIVSVGLTGCTSSEPAPIPSGSGTASASPAPDAASTSAPLAESVATLPDGRGTVGVAVRSLVADDNGTTMTLRVDFTPHLAAPDDAMTLSMVNNFFFIFPELLDRENLKRYSVITGEGPQDWLTNKDATTSDGEPLASWFVFAAPEDAIDSFTLTMDGWGLEIPGVEVAA
jgi:hypothetical protein